MIDRSLAQAKKIYNDVDLHVCVQDAYGKGFMKKCKLSPDAYIQMALQLAHYRVGVIIGTISRRNACLLTTFPGLGSFQFNLRSVDDTVVP